MIVGMQNSKKSDFYMKEDENWLPIESMPLNEKVWIKTATGMIRLAVGRWKNKNKVRCLSRDKPFGDLVAVAWKPVTEASREWVGGLYDAKQKALDAAHEIALEIDIVSEPEETARIIAAYEQALSQECGSTPKPVESRHWHNGQWWVPDRHSMKLNLPAFDKSAEAFGGPALESLGLRHEKPTPKQGDDCREADLNYIVKESLHRMNLDRPDIAALKRGATISVKIDDVWWWRNAILVLHDALNHPARSSEVKGIDDAEAIAFGDGYNKGYAAAKKDKSNG